MANDPESILKSEQIWFVAKGDHTEGPFGAQEVEEIFLKTANASKMMIWGRGCEAWMHYHEWLGALRQKRRTEEAGSHEDRWFLELDKQVYGPYERAEMVTKLDGLRDSLQRILLRCNGDVWLDMRHFPELLDQLNIARVQFRAPLLGRVSVMIEGKLTEAKACDINDAGIGLTGIQSLGVGRKVNLLIESASLQVPISASATICFQSDDGRVGLRFEYLSAEARAVILDYVTKFSKLLNRERFAPQVKEAA